MDTFLETLKNLGPARLGMMMLTLFGLFIFFIFIAVRSNTPNMTLLYGDLSISDSTEIAAKLELSHIPYTISDDGKQISVPHKHTGKSRMLLAKDGLPRNASLGYEIFDKKQSFGTTNFVQNINQLRAMEGELARTITTLDAIRSTRVHLVLAQRQLFSREKRSASASVFISTQGNIQLDTGQISAIQHLTASAVPQLKPESVSIIDSNGTLLASGKSKGSVSIGSQDENKKQEYEQHLTQVIEDMIGKVVGYDKVRANVTADLNFNILTRNSERYDPEGQVVRSTQTTTEEDIDNTGGITDTVTVQNNLPGLPNAGRGNSSTLGTSSNRTEETVNYEITKTLETFVQESGEVQKISVAILVDGRYKDIEVEKGTDEEKADEEGKAKPKRQYIPRTQIELDQISTLIKSAIGFDADRGDTLEVINMQFAEIEFFEEDTDKGLLLGFEKEDIMGMVETLTLSIVAILVILLVLRPLVNHISAAAAQNTQRTTSDEETALLAGGTAIAGQIAGPDGSTPLPEGATPTSELDAMLDVNQVEGQVKASSVQKISELVDKHPTEAVSVIRNWMSQES